MDDKSNYPRAPQVSFGKAVAIGLGAGAIGALRYLRIHLHMSIQ